MLCAHKRTLSAKHGTINHRKRNVPDMNILHRFGNMNANHHHQRTDYLIIQKRRENGCCQPCGKNQLSFLSAGNPDDKIRSPGRQAAFAECRAEDFRSEDNQNDIICKTAHHFGRGTDSEQNHSDTGSCGNCCSREFIGNKYDNAENEQD